LEGCVLSSGKISPCSRRNKNHFPDGTGTCLAGTRHQSQSRVQERA